MRQADRFWVLWGIARSLLIYYAKPGRARRDRQFYSQFIGKGALVFDIGAHVGNRVNVFLRLGARCVAVEPQPAFASLLRLFYGRNPAFTLEQAALAAAPGQVDLHISRRTPTVSTTSADWKTRVGRSPSFANVTWDETIPALTMTLDQLINRYGAPDLCKIDVEGSELAVLQGLSRPLPLLSLEYISGGRRRSGRLPGTAGMPRQIRVQLESRRTAASARDSVDLGLRNEGPPVDLAHRGSKWRPLRAAGLTGNRLSQIRKAADRPVARAEGLGLSERPCEDNVTGSQGKAACIDVVHRPNQRVERVAARVTPEVRRSFTAIDP